MEGWVHNNMHHDPRLQEEGRAEPQVIVISDDELEEDEAWTLSQAVFGDQLENIAAFINGFEGLASVPISPFLPVVAPEPFSHQENLLSDFSFLSSTNKDRQLLEISVIDRSSPTTSVSSLGDLIGRSSPTTSASLLGNHCNLID